MIHANASTCTSEIVFLHVLIGAEIHLAQSQCFINAADLYPPGIGSSDLDKCMSRSIQHPEPGNKSDTYTVCSLLALDHRLLCNGRTYWLGGSALYCNGGASVNEPQQLTQSLADFHSWGLSLIMNKALLIM